MIRENDLILAQGQYYSTDCYETQLNNNVLVVGSSGSGKTRSIVSPNILQANGSYIISDPKGGLYPKYGKYLESKGYEVQILDFTRPERSTNYNCFKYVHGEKDILKMAHILTYSMGASMINDPFWDEAVELLLTSLIAYMKDRHTTVVRPTMSGLLHLVSLCQINEDYSSNQTALDELMLAEEKRDPNSFAVKQYKKFRIAAGKTLKSILISLNSKLGKFDYKELNKMMACDQVDLTSFGRRKKALFVVTSDTDRSLDGLVNIFFSQAMNELCHFADEKCKDRRLPVDVRFILDDFATNCRIEGFPQMISNIRARGISAMIMIQAEAQLEAGYKADARTIISNCDTYVYLGGNDVDTAKLVAMRCNLPYYKILNMPVGTNWIFRRGQTPINGKNFILEDYKKERGMAEDAILLCDVHL